MTIYSVTTGGVVNALDVSQFFNLLTGTMTDQQVTVSNRIRAQLSGATAGAGGLVGQTTGGAPVSGTFVAGDWLVDLNSALWVCTSGGTPGTWLQKGGLLAWGNRATSSSTTTTEIGVLRLDSISLAANRAYRIWTNPLFLLSTVSNDVIAARLRISTVGTAGTGSTQLGNSLQLKTDSSQPPSGALVALYQPGASAVTLSVILTVGRASGTGNVSIFGTSDLIVEDAGPALTDAGVDI